MQYNKHTILHLSLISGIGPALVEALMHNQEVFEQLYTLLPSDIAHVCGITLNAAQKVVEGLQDRTALEKELKLLEKHKISLITIADDAYPPLLKEIYLPPSALYVQGTLTNDMAVAFVGSRAASLYGKRIVNRLVPPLSQAGLVIVSGGAHGIDAYTHQATLESGGKTIAVLGSGLLRPYPAGNRRLFEQIAERGGAVISSFPLEMEPVAGNFPARNRIISGLSRGTVVVQAAEKSGALITARYALEQGREVFAVPGAIDDELSAGCHTLIKQGATLTVFSSDIMEAFGLMTNSIHGQKQEIKQVTIAQGIKDNDVPMVSAKPTTPADLIVQSCMSPCSLDELLAITLLTMPELHSLLFELQLQQKITQTMAGLWHAL
ncbi:MAG: DNA-processing protein DprA [Candidatus Dependentiae bacterium]|nr:DNA-processing protein DprA [Candidatus Dependentiae bacterium]